MVFLFLSVMLSVFLFSKVHLHPPTNAIALGMYHGGHCHLSHLLPIFAL